MKEEDKERIELSEENQQRIEDAAFNHKGCDMGCKCTDFICNFSLGAKYEHPIAFNQGYELGFIEGFNEGIESVVEILYAHLIPEAAHEIFKEIEKLKR